MLQLAWKIIGLTAIVTSLSSLTGAISPEISPGSFYLVNVGFTGRRIITGEGKGVILPNQGYPVATSLFTVDSTMTTLFNEEAQQFAVVDASDGGSAGSGIILCPTLFPAPPLNAIGNSDWSFLQGTQGTIITLSGGRNLAWSLQQQVLELRQVSHECFLTLYLLIIPKDYPTTLESFGFETAMDFCCA
ncbi:hypothetical protein GALMADRAFT_208016 [Galerina marginata CBS 339.88]|uniref:Uncharacterized protein n=1 Tax=Galerina marginata (strain CBS 339.88) TaxID=685588 RepID=A0A067TQD5_GALM3|nr:hypothetical protein GALMADRAFT_208016 [Galerina marginata CBS 339.88]